MDEMSEDLMIKMKNGKKLEEALKQNKYTSHSAEDIIKKFGKIGENSNSEAEN